ncbi:MAG: AbrB/MazE/SpoVT family DNA-binding domain-containing protein [Methanobacteriaceae archaeon]|jgi:AbrB family looped-hinge helix DNA binding protein|nr:AbrB/MazE/SpoVT family DNA-binding domain-containing protein [Methanobacteriaceae archaeon]
MIKTSLFNGFQTVIPSKIRKKLNLSINDSLEWELTDDNEIKIKIIKENQLKDLTKFSINAPHKTDSVDLKRKSAAGEF